LSFFGNVNLTLIEEACDRVLKDKAFKGFMKGPYITVYEYEAKLRDALIKLSFDGMSLDVSKPVVTLSCESTENSGQLLIPPIRISNPVDAYSEAQNIWAKICQLDKARVGNLNDFKYFEYLDNIFQWAYYIRKLELEKGRLVDYSMLDYYCQAMQNEAQTEFTIEVAKKDVCKLMAERTILDRFTKEKESDFLEYDDRIFLEARLLVESDYPGVSKFKARKY
jgi:hypothetical protein